MRRFPVTDAVGLLLFVAIGALSHGASVGAFLRDAAILFAAWLGVALFTRHLLVRWALGVTLFLVVRALVVGHAPPVAFVVTTFAFVLLFVYAVRFSATLLRRSRIASVSGPRSSRRGS